MHSLCLWLRTRGRPSSWAKLTRAPAGAPQGTTASRRRSISSQASLALPCCHATLESIGLVSRRSPIITSGRFYCSTIAPGPISSSFQGILLPGSPRGGRAFCLSFSSSKWGSVAHSNPAPVPNASGFSTASLLRAS
jgi:hypothetical protein